MTDYFRDLDKLTDLVRAAHEWGQQESSHFYGRRNIRRSSRKKLVWWWAEVNGMTLKAAESDLSHRLRDIWEGC